MAILVDMSQLMYSIIFVQGGLRPGQEIEEGLIRHSILDSLRHKKQKFEDKYGRFVLCFDSRHYWRKDVFPNYKYHRKQTREDSGFDWDTIFDVVGRIRKELEEYMPWQCMEVEGTEADDIIAVLTKKYHLNEKILILGTDKDFQQLQKFKNVVQYSTVLGEFLVPPEKDPQKFLNLHIMKGDRGDGIPNFLSGDDVFVKGIRQKSLPRVDKLNIWATLAPERFCTEDMLRGWKRNDLLINFEHIPKEFQSKILTEFKKPYNITQNKIYDYFVKKKLNKLIGSIQQFKVNEENEQQKLISNRSADAS